MAFSEKIKEEARKLSDGQCVMCKREIALKIHHIIPQEEGGPDTLDNAAPLCANCHEIYGSNPTKRKLIRQQRDNWYARVKEASKSIEQLVALHQNPNNDTKRIAIYHVVYENENFEDAASTLFGLISNAQQKFPDYERILYLDIDGHRDKKGVFDEDMFELQCQYILGFLFKYLSKAYLPIVEVENKEGQRNDIPEKFFILSNDEQKQNFLKQVEGKTIYLEDDIDS